SQCGTSNTPPHVEDRTSWNVESTTTGAPNMGVDDDVLQDLERMEKESDLDDILNYRSAAEFEMQEYLSRYSTPNNGRSHTDISAEKSGNDENNVKSRGWLNWLSRGMLGAGVAFGDVWLYTMVTGTVLGNNGWRKVMEMILS
ncbi:hypothetical protein L195_g010335, partial [Trifolium pratense]